MKQDAFSLKLLLGRVCHRTRKNNRAKIGTMSGVVAILNLTIQVLGRILEYFIALGWKIHFVVRT